jgi:trans-aconitate methyltransferase
MSVKTHFNLSAADYEAFRTGHLEDRRRQLIEDAIASRTAPTRHVIELGCGPGKLLADLAGRRPEIAFTGVEIDPKMVEHARDRHRLLNVRYELADITRNELPGRCDLLFSIDVLHHVHDLPPFLTAVRRLLETGGTWVAVEPNIYHPYIYYSQERMRRAGFDEDHFRPWVFEPLARQAGFAVRSRGYRFLFPGWIRRVPAFLGPVERLCERARFLGGSVVYTLLAE